MIETYKLLTGKYDQQVALTFSQEAIAISYTRKEL